MNIHSINFQPPSVQKIQKESIEANKNVNTAENFESFYKSALGMWNKTNQLQKEAENMALEFAAGRLDNFHSLSIAQSKASIALEYTVQVRNQILDAYREIMRLQL
ncbi:MAG: flagellar hook-basal body complex protein FliE [Epulopiscium sp.]|nr:flagellar hook-basal body complex protein FliE [Candidatus Epulonipiscium sp.]